MRQVANMDGYPVHKNTFWLVQSSLVSAPILLKLV